MTSGVPLVSNGWICIDTFAFGGEYLTGLDVGSGELYQAKQTGATRVGLNVDEL